MTSEETSSADTAAPRPGSPSRPVRIWRELAPIRDQLFEDILICTIGTVGLAAFVLAGGFLFSALEGGLEQQVKCGVRHEQLKFLDELWAKSDQLDRRAWRGLARQHLNEYEAHLLTAYTSGVTSPSGQRLWTVGNSAVYAWTIVTTLGGCCTSVNLCPALGSCLVCAWFHGYFHEIFCTLKKLIQ